MENFVWFDVITLGLISILAIKGIVNGFVRELFGLVGIIGGIYLASRFATKAGDWISANIFAIDNKSALFITGFIAILLIFWIISIFLGLIFAKMLSLSGLGIVDKIAGFIVGGAKIFFVLSVLFLALSNVGFIQEKLNQYLKGSFMYPSFIKTGSFIVNIKPNFSKIDNKINITVNETNSTESSAKADQNTSPEAASISAEQTQK